MIPERYFNNLGTFFTEDMQNTLLEKTVCVFGCGGFGSWVVELLAKLGVKKIICFDNDSFEEADICQKQFASYETLGRKKTDVALEACQKINPDIIYNFYNFDYDPSYQNLILDSDVIINAADMPLDTTLSLMETFKDREEMYLITGFLSEHSFITAVFDLRKDQEEYIHYSTIMEERLKAHEIRVTTTGKPDISGPSYLASLGGCFLVGAMVDTIFYKDKIAAQGLYNFRLNTTILIPTYFRGMFDA